MNRNSIKNKIFLPSNMYRVFYEIAIFSSFQRVSLVLLNSILKILSFYRSSISNSRLENLMAQSVRRRCYMVITTPLRVLRPFFPVETFKIARHEIRY